MGPKYYLGIDVGGSKTLFAVFEAAGKKIFEHKIKTPKVYDELIASIAKTLKTELADYKITAACCAIPGWIDFDKGVAIGFGNLPWENVPVLKDLEAIMPGIKVLLHNDAKLAGLSEAKLLPDKYRKIMYLTVSTGIGGGLIIDGVINPDFANFEPGQMMFDYQGKPTQWEDFASGRTLKEHTGQLARDLEDEAAWKEFSGLIALGLEELLATIQPEVVVFGGSVGAHFEKFKDFLEEDLNAIKNPLVPIPPLVKAHRPEEAVIYGCYDYIVQNAR
jgi:predicted NBD/HSP70 family sugar kinase